MRMLAFTLASPVVARCMWSMTLLTVSLREGVSSIGKRGRPRERERVALLATLATLAVLGSLLAAEGSREGP